ncbi:PilW family protein [Rappaport israeli]|uniref:PilW family protein n=1 Tax=Rappaport israeli TaxID=1839807 RepID=UPI000930AFC6|nr:prepilin-type N-terminal cleavage/methylation domain-containing protein [Rappaport israeli]
MLLNKQKGATLLELMISLSIGVILLLTLASVYLTASNTNKLRNANADLDDAARQIFDRLKYDLDLAGYIDIFDADANGNKVAEKLVKLSDEGVQNMYGRIMDTSSASSIAPKTPIEEVTGRRGLVGTDNSLTITYQVLPVTTNTSANPVTLPTAVNANSGWGLDCLSQDQGNKFITNKYIYENNTFICETVTKSGGIGSQPLVGEDSVDGTTITQMTFRYLVTNPAEKTTDVNVYNSQSGLYVSDIKTASEVEASLLKWAGVTGVEVCMVVAGAPLQGSLENILENQPTLPVCTRKNDGTFADNITRPNEDDRLYQRYVKIFNVPNALYLSP